MPSWYTCGIEGENEKGLPVEKKSVEKVTLVHVAKKLGMIIRSAKAGLPVYKEMADRIRSKEKLENPTA